jgi:TetR/AcrR family fatty acid metabolism transcriptional regulator
MSGAAAMMMEEREPGAAREERRRAILESAVRAFAEHGFLAAKVRDIAAGAGVAEGTIYLYYGGKDDLLLTAFREQVAEFCATVQEILASPLPFAARLERFIELQLASIEADPALAMVVLVESRQTSRFYGDAVRDVLRDYAAAIDTLLESGIESGEVHPDSDVAIARRMLIGTLEEVELEWLLGDRARPLVRFAPRVARTLYHGIAAG